MTPDEIADYLALLGTRDTKTRGAWIENGQLVEIISGRHDLAYEQAINYWRVGWQHHYPTVRGWQGDLATHAEVKAAIQMGWEGTSNRHRTMVINHAGGPCGGDLGCQDYLDTFIPPGCSLTVYYPGGYRIFGGRER
ncbi:DddA-like double-stranded DNA deaminase toxin [Stackebrandtia albiflava]|uniref:DddA-like double-stranded DNA deaminase toxin n=1 Tax=Stackebrandtia albiflava TaxID=406432 RepID=UPI0013159C0C|nr:DddA-like double-stranded DNA deaminase toxin [Stackebrandtia albiflava]